MRRPRDLEVCGGDVGVDVDLAEVRLLLVLEAEVGVLEVELVVVVRVVLLVVLVVVVVIKVVGSDVSAARSMRLFVGSDPSVRPSVVVLASAYPSNQLD